ncbi:hypothetical protein KEM60_01245 [Austwickia sp. TVS 96-490-7B]|uniref:hypothetical protein n=1 Tax=Austwickia sp. TVS 96-490-7B TaxID=2830843 RepID=UPI001C563467|nr:hypothetical protein [Austwickia sp. TVS 96-490-7B]MBW3085053.1 hypothetical protein [Austwickia sp. TVS 96-490-7B]
MTLLWVVVAWCAGIIVHTCGHYIAFRAVGVPAAEVRVRYGLNGGHIELRDGDTWVVPGNPTYVPIFIRLVPHRRHTFLTIAAGQGTELLVAAAAVLALVHAEQNGLASVVAGVSAALFLVDLAIGLATTLSWRRPTCDAASLWVLAPDRALGFLIISALARLALVFLANV